MEFLMGRSLKNNLYNLNLTDVFASVLADYGVKLENLYECEPDAGLGNDTASADLPPAILTRSQPTRIPRKEDIPYFMNGIFKQKLVDGWQTELPDFWLPGGEYGLSPTKRAHLRFALRAA